jgi:TATA-binding protein-associated factor Taf7
MGPDGKLKKEKYDIDKETVIPTLIIINIHPGIQIKYYVNIWKR